MSAIAGICYWDGRPIPESQLTLLTGYSRAVAPDGGGAIAPVPGLALQAHLLRFDRLSAGERQPHVFGQGSVLTLDGRLDNREDLLVTLHRDLGPDDVSDAALVSAAYAKWGLDALRRLIGDWSLALWDAPTRRLVLARDYMGNRPLHYLELAGGFAWATSLDGLAACFDRDGEPDDSYIAGRLVYGVPPEVTPFKGIRVLRAGHVLVATEGDGVSVRRYWTFEPSRLRYRDPDAYTDHLRELLTDAVRVRLRADRPVWSHLSGGFDSSSIVCIANALIRRSRVEAPAVQPLSWVISSSPESDESRFIEAVEQWCGLRSVRREWEQPYLTFPALMRQRRPLPLFSDESLEASVHAAGDRVVLSGELGDLVMLKGSSHAVSLLEPLHEGHAFSFLRDCLTYAKRRRRFMPRVLSRIAWAAYAPVSVQEAVLSRRSGVRRAREQQVSPRNVADTYGVTPRLMAFASKRSVDHPSVAAFPIVKRRFVMGLYQLGGHAALSSTADARHIRMTFPYTHRPLVEFMLAVPQRAFWSPHASRVGMKQALHEVLPPELLARTSKGEPATALERASRSWTVELARAVAPSEPVASWQLVRREYVQAKALARATDNLFEGKEPGRFMRECLYLEAWLRGMTSSGSANAQDAQPDGQSTVANVGSVARGLTATLG